MNSFRSLFSFQAVESLHRWLNSPHDRVWVLSGKHSNLPLPWKAALRVHNTSWKVTWSPPKPLCLHMDDATTRDKGKLVWNAFIIVQIRFLWEQTLTPFWLSPEEETEESPLSYPLAIHLGPLSFKYMILTQMAVNRRCLIRRYIPIKT